MVYIFWKVSHFQSTPFQFNSKQVATLLWWFQWQNHFTFDNQSDIPVAMQVNMRSRGRHRLSNSIAQTGLSIIPFTALTFRFLKHDMDDSLLLVDPDIIHLATTITRTLKVVPEDVITQRKIFTNGHLHCPVCLFLLLCQNIIKPCDWFCPASVLIKECHHTSNAKTPLAKLDKCQKRWVSHFE